MAVTIEDIQRSLLFAVWIWVYAVSAFVGYILLRAIYNISPLHPLYKYPGPLLWRASRLPASYHQARGDLYARIADIHTHYGPTIRLSPDELSFTAPEAWLDIYNSRPQLQKSDYHFPPPVKEKLPASMITASDAEHTRLRRLANPAFLNAGIAEVEPILQHFVDLLCTQLIDASKEGSQNICEWLLWALNDVISKLALDRDFQCLEKRRMHPWPALLLDSLKQAALVNQLRWFGVSLRLLQPLMTEQQLKAQEYFYNTAQTAIKERLAREKSESTATTNGEKKRPDIVGLMLREMKDGNRLTEQEITANSILIVVGGAETTSTLLSAAFYHLCKTPRVMQKLKAEIRRKFASPDEITIKSTADVPYLKATLDETLRIFPVASYITPRVIPKGGHLVNGELVPEGTYVSMGQWFMGRSDRFFDHPHELRPERWLDDELDTKGPAGLKADEILRPFSLGPRNCIGKLVALSEARLILAKMLWHFDMELDGEHPTWVEDARFFVLWELQPLAIKLKPVKR